MNTPSQDSPIRRRAICVFCGAKSGNDPRWVNAAFDLGRALANAKSRDVNSGLWDIPGVYEFAVAKSPSATRYKTYVGTTKSVRDRHGSYLRDGDHIQNFFEAAVKALRSSGAVRHGAECFNFHFPQELDTEFLVCWAGFQKAPMFNKVPAGL